MDAIVPITRFNRGEASKIFDEVNARGVKIVLKNNVPACVLVQPERYEEMVEALNDYALFFEAERRTKASGSDQTIPSETVLKHLGISKEDLQDIEVEIE
ncbi:MAG: type II toxin-antitoxin system Phd/YefM family antitoxin [Syntrophomonadaceae bacterium]|nr:type II toxin-antitoxin system Phd/YefM family antitoxin [Syntrophomonadaceae bacterium]